MIHLAAFALMQDKKIFYMTTERTIEAIKIRINEVYGQAEKKSVRVQILRGDVTAEAVSNLINNYDLI